MEEPEDACRVLVACRRVQSLRSEFVAALRDAGSNAYQADDPTGSSHREGFPELVATAESGREQRSSARPRAGAVLLSSLTRDRIRARALFVDGANVRASDVDTADHSGSVSWPRRVAWGA